MAAQRKFPVSSHASSCKSGDVRCLLRRSDQDVNDRNQDGWTVLTSAVLDGNTEIVQMLLAREDIDIQASKITAPAVIKSEFHGNLCSFHMASSSFLE
jgi:ankyrin repeat protein